MRNIRVLQSLSAVALVLTFGGCGAGDGDELGGATEAPGRADGTASTTIVEDEEIGRSSVDADRATEPIDSTIPGDTTAPGELTPTDDDGDGSTPPPSTDRTDEWRRVTGFDVPEAPAPGGLADAVLPTDVDGAIALFDTLPGELIGGSKSISAQTQGDLAADYLSPERASRYGFQAMDLPNSYMGSMLRAIVGELDLDTVPEPSADMLVALFVLSDDDDYEVERAGHEGDLYWVTMITTGSGYGIDGVEEVHTVIWGEAGGAWAFTAGAPTEAGRDQLIAAFVEAAANVPDRQPKSTDELAAGAALLTVDDLGAEWLSRPHIPQDGEAFGELAATVMADQPMCSAALEWVESEGVALSGLLDVLTATSLARADSPTFMYEAVEVQHTVMVFESTDRRADSFRSIGELGWVDCVLDTYSDLASAQFGAMFPGTTVVVDAADERPLDLGDDSISLRFELTLRAPDGGGELGVVQDVAIVAIGRAASAVVHQTFGDGVDEAQLNEVIERATARLAEQFGEPSGGGS